MNPLGTGLTRLGLFETTATGLVALAPVVIVGLTVADGGDAAAVWAQVLAGVRNSTKEIGTTACFLLAAYLAGSVIRAIKVDTADRLCRRLFGWAHRDEFSRRMAGELFPYPGLLANLFKSIVVNGPLPGAKLPEPGTHHATFDFWKLELAQVAPAAFAYVQQFEARVRLFAGMVWAGLLGTLATLAGLGYAAVRLDAPVGFQTVLLVQLGLSAAVLVVFGFRLRFVRGTEVAHVFLAHLRFGGGRAGIGPSDPPAGGDGPDGLVDLPE